MTVNNQYWQAYREYADYFNELMERLEASGDKETREAVRKLDALGERLRVAQSNLIKGEKF